MSPDTARQHRRHHETSRGYEASEDTDTLPENDPRSRAYDTAGASRRRERDERDRFSGDTTATRGNRNQDSGQPRDRDAPRESDRDHDTRRSSKSTRERPQQDPEDSDATIELEPRFDEKGRKKGTEADDPLASKIEDMLAGRGTSGKLFGNFMEGIFGPEGRSADKGEGSGGKERRRRVDRDRE
jgi:hypothetical protein